MEINKKTSKVIKDIKKEILIEMMIEINSIEETTVQILIVVVGETIVRIIGIIIVNLIEIIIEIIEIIIEIIEIIIEIIEIIGTTIVIKIILEIIEDKIIVNLEDNKEKDKIEDFNKIEAFKMIEDFKETMDFKMIEDFNKETNKIIRSLNQKLFNN